MYLNLDNKAPRQAVNAGQRLLRRYRRRQRAGRRHPDQASVLHPVGHGGRQLQSALAPQHQEAQQADILFGGIPLRHDQAVQRRFQDGTVGGAQPLDVVAVAQVRGLQKRRRLARQPDVQLLHLAAEPPDGPFRRRVYAGQRRHGAVADAVAGIVVGLVGKVLYIALPKRAAVCRRLGAGQAQAGPHINAPPFRDAGHAVQAGAPRQTEQQRFSLVGQGVRRGDLGFLAGGQRVEPGVPQAARPVLAGMGRDLHAFPHRIVDKQLYPVAAAEFPHKIGVAAGILAPDPMIHMGGQHPDGQFAPAPGEKQQQGHRVCPTGAGRNDPVAGLEQPTLPAEGQQLFFCLFDHGINRSRHGCNPNS